MRHTHTQAVPFHVPTVHLPAVFHQPVLLISYIADNAGSCRRNQQNLRK